MRSARPRMDERFWNGGAVPPSGGDVGDAAGVGADLAGLDRTAGVVPRLGAWGCGRSGG